MGPTPGYVPKTPFANVKSNGCSNSPPSAENWKCGSRRLRAVLTWKSYFPASSTEFFTSRLFESAMETASSSVRSGSSCVACCASDPIGDANTRIVRSSARWFDFIISYLDFWLRPDGTLNLSESCCRSCAPRLQVPCQPGVPCKFLNQKCGRTRLLKNAHIRSMSAALMWALAAVASAQHAPRTTGTLFRVTL